MLYSSEHVEPSMIDRYLDKLIECSENWNRGPQRYC